MHNQLLLDTQVKTTLLGLGLLKEWIDLFTQIVYQ